MKTKLLLLLLLANCSIYAQYTKIPDINFEKALIEKGIDSGEPDGQVLTSKIASLTDLFIDAKSIKSLSGIEDFTSLINFQCDSNLLTEIDVSKNTALNYLSVGENLLTNLDVTKNTALTALYFFDNQISSIDLSKNTALTWLNFTGSLMTSLDISKNTALTHLFCESNKLSALDISKNTLLEHLFSDNNKLTTLDVSNNPLLSNIFCKNNQLTNLDVSKNVKLHTLECDNNMLTSLDISKNLLMGGLTCSFNLLTSLDLSKHTSLDYLWCNSNQLNSLNLKNGNNANFPRMGDNFKDNPNLTCIQVDDVDFSNKNWGIAKDEKAYFSLSCDSPNPTHTLLPDQKFEQKLIDLGIDTDGLNGKISSSDISAVTSLDLSNSNITDLSGIENFTSLTNLDCSNNQITNLNLSYNLLLERLIAFSNQITSLDLSKNSKLTIVYVVSNPLVFLNLQNGNNKNMIILNVTGKNAASYATSFLGLNQLACIKVDDAAFSNTNWSKIKETSTTYSTSCSLGIEDSVFDKVTLYPNPTKEEVTIANISLEKATVYNTLGQLVKSFTLNSGDSNNTISLSDLPKGVYYVYLINKDAATVKKVIVE
ncbi:leucine-rich repeat domain-containing protein [Flavobacterium hydrophilum]|nr:leucine-rich repeat domain-containing protein [Flavobacterium hydrophilum]